MLPLSVVGASFCGLFLPCAVICACVSLVLFCGLFYGPFRGAGDVLRALASKQAPNLAAVPLVAPMVNDALALRFIIAG